MARARLTRKLLGFKDRISRLTHHQATRLLGEDGARLMRTGSRTYLIEPTEDVYVGSDLLRMIVHDSKVANGKAIVVLTMMSGRDQQLHLKCDQCDVPCLHAGAALDMLLNEKLILGLAAPPDETVPAELLTPEELTLRAIDERQQRSAAEKMTVRSLDASAPWTDYLVTSHQSGKTYRVALHGATPGQSYCSCPDFRTNRLGVCKHTLHALAKVKQRFKAKQLAQKHEPRRIALYVDYQSQPAFRLQIPSAQTDEVRELLGATCDSPIADAQEALRCVRRLESSGCDVLIYPDAEHAIERQLTQLKLQALCDEIRRDPAQHPLRRELLKVELLPYQMDGIAFAVGAGRALLADDMGLGKTIQGIGVAELLARQMGIQRVLVICPATLKSQWRDEVRKFSNRSAEIVAGRNDERARQYSQGEFFTICNYEQVLRDLSLIEQVPWDLIVLDEAQRIKNWQSKTSRVVQSLRSRFALVLTGTPLENRLDELFNVVRFVDEQALGPAHEFFHRHREVDDTGRVLGFRKLDDVRARLRPVLLRRTRAAVMEQLPERTTTVVRIRPTEEQLELSTNALRAVTRITRKAYLTEMDLLMLQKHLLIARMAADSTVLVDKQAPGYSTKLERIAELLAELADQTDRKAIIFSEWRQMLNLIEPLLEQVGMRFVRVDGKISQQQRAQNVRQFQTDPECRAILMTNAGSTGLNLQSANVVINVDLPWNPAVLEQRIARAHRMGQRNPVNVYLLVTENTIEERMLDTLAMKQDLANAALDINSDISQVMAQGGIEELRRRLERLLGETPSAPIDESQLQRVTDEATQINERRERVAAAGGQLLGAAIQMLGELVGSPPSVEPAAPPADSSVDLIRSRLTDCVERDSNGRPQLRITLPDESAIQQLAMALAKLLAGAEPGAGPAKPN